MDLTRRLPRELRRWIIVGALLGAFVPIAELSLGYPFLSLADGAPQPIRMLLFAVVLLIVLAWPPATIIFEMKRVSAPTGDIFAMLALQVFGSLCLYAALSALFWCALYRDRRAWIPFAGILGFFWWPFAYAIAVGVK